MVTLIILAIFLYANSNTALLLNNVDVGTVSHLESLIRNMNATMQAMNSTIEEKVNQLQNSK